MADIIRDSERNEMGMELRKLDAQAQNHVNALVQIQTQISNLETAMKSDDLYTDDDIQKVLFIKSKIAGLTK